MAVNAAGLLTNYRRGEAVVSIEYIRKTYGVPAWRGGRVIFHALEGRTYGTITGSKNALLRIRMDDGYRGLYHPTFKLEYLAPQTTPEGTT